LCSKKKRDFFSGFLPMLDLQPSDRRHGAPSSSGGVSGGDELIRTYKGWKGNNVSFFFFFFFISFMIGFCFSGSDLMSLNKI